MAGKDGRHEADTIQLQGRTLSRVTSVSRGVTACLSPDDGAELSSLTLRDVSGTYELLYRGNDWRPVDGWTGRAPWLWPAAGRSYGRNDPTGAPIPQSIFHWNCGERVLPMPHHGFARLKQWRAETTTLVDGGAQSHASLQSNGEDQASYPFNYRLDAVVSICDSSVTLTLQVTAGRNNDQAMPFTIGQHLTLDLASWWGQDWLHGTLEGAGQLGRGVDALMLAGGRLDLSTQPLELADPVLGDCLIPAAPARALRMTSPDRTKYLDLSFTASSLPSEDAALWVTHRDPAGRFFCLEPWVGWPNGLNSGHGRIELQPGAVWSMSFKMNMMSVDQEDTADLPLPDAIHITPGVVGSMPRRGRRSTTENQTVTEDT